MPTNDQVILGRILREKQDELTAPISDSTFFELFSAEQILKDYDLSWAELESGIVANGGDGGIDGFYTFINGELVHEDTNIADFRGDIKLELHIMQAKRESGFSGEVIQKFRSTAEDLLDLSMEISSLSGTYNDELISSAKRFREAFQHYASRIPELSIAFYFTSLGEEVHPSVERQVSSLGESISKLFSSAIFTFDFLDARKLLELYRKRPRTAYELKLSDSPISTESNAYVCLVGITDYYKFITDDEGTYIRALFDANVRDHQGNVQVNKGIRNTLANPQDEDFWWLNNGITILASRANLSAKTLTLENPRVVNGLQTSVEIYKYMSERENEDESRSLLVRVIVPGELDSNDRIIFATNSQTSIPIASLRSTDKIHRDIEDYFKGEGLYYDRRKNQYKNEGKPLDRIVSIGFVAQAVMSQLLGHPNDARARPSTLLKDDEDYQQVFNQNYALDIYLKLTLTQRLVDDFLKSGQVDISRKDINNIKFHVSMFAAWLLLNRNPPKPTDIQKIDLSAFTGDHIQKSLTEVWKIYEALGADDQVAKGKEFLEGILIRLGELTYKGRIPPSSTR